MNRSKAAVALVVAALEGVAVVAQEQTRSVPAAAIKSTLAAVVTLRAYDAAGNEIGLGSGFFLPDGRIATNRHVVAGASLVEARSSNGSLVGSFSYLEVMSVSSDLALLPRIDNPPATTRLAATPAEIGTHVYVIGAPLGLEGTVSDGIISGVRLVEGLSLLQMTAPISPGSSGGPVIDDSGSVVGVSVGRLPGGQNLNFAVPVHDLVALTASPPARIPFPPPEANTDQPASKAAERPLPSLLDAARMSEARTSFDGNIRIDSKGCFGAAQAPDVLVCVCEFFSKTADDRERSVGLWRASLISPDGGRVVAESATNLSDTFLLSGGQPGRTRQGVRVVVRGVSVTRIFIKFLMNYQPTLTPSLHVEVGAGSAERVHRFPPTAIVPIDPTGDYRIRALFGIR